MRIAIVDDDNLVVHSLTTIVQTDSEIEVAGTASNGQDAVKLFSRLLPDILLMDIRMQTLSGLDAAEQILKSHPQARIIFLTTFADDAYIIKALKIGAKGYILKHDYQSLVPALHAVHSGQTVFGDDIISKLPSLINEERKLSDFGLTQKESDIVTLVAQGLSNKEIAAALYLSEGTVRNAISVIFEKLDLRDRTQLAVFYYKSKRV